MRVLPLLLLALSGCATHAEVAMINPVTGHVVGCEKPNDRSGSARFLTSRMCVSACQAHGFRVFAGEAPPEDGVPGDCD